MSEIGLNTLDFRKVNSLIYYLLTCLPQLLWSSKTQSLHITSLRPSVPSHRVRPLRYITLIALKDQTPLIRVATHASMVTKKASDVTPYPLGSWGHSGRPLGVNSKLHRIKKKILTKLLYMLSSEKKSPSVPG